MGVFWWENDISAYSSDILSLLTLTAICWILWHSCVQAAIHVGESENK